MCIQSCSAHALCICCAQWFPLCLMFTPQAEQFLNKEKKLSRVRWNLWAGCVNSSIYLSLMTVELKASKWQCHWTEERSQTWPLPSWPTAVLKSHLSDCENKWVSGGCIARGSKWVLLSVCSGGWFGIARRKKYEWWRVGEVTGEGTVAADKWQNRYTSVGNLVLG